MRFNLCSDKFLEFVRHRKLIVCSCLKVLPRVFVDAVKNLPGGLDEEHTVDELTGWLSQVYEHLLLYTVQSDGDNSCAIGFDSVKAKKRLGNFYTPRDLARFTAEKSVARTRIRTVRKTQKCRADAQIESCRRLNGQWNVLERGT